MAPQPGIQELVGHRLLDKDGNNVGKIGQVYRDDQTHQPTWVTVQTGMFGTQESFVPLVGAQIAEEDLRVPFTKSLIKDSPRFESGGHLSPDEETQLYRHYGVQPTVPEPRGEAAEERRTAEAGPAAGTVPRGQEEAAVTRSEEQARVGVERRESGRAHVRKSVETEPFEEEVPVRREEVHVEREPVTERERARGGGRIGEEEEDIVLHEERAVLGKEEVPVERVRVSKEEVSDTEHVRGQLRKERIEVDEDEEGGPRRGRRS